MAIDADVGHHWEACREVFYDFCDQPFAWAALVSHPRKLGLMS